MTSHRSRHHRSRPRLLSDTHVSTQSEFEAVKVVDVMDYLSLTMDEAMVYSLVRTAMEQFEDITGHYLEQQTRRAVFDRYATRYRLPSKPVTSLDTVESVHEGTTTTETVADWWLEDSVSPVEIKATGDANLTDPYDVVRFEYTAGYASLSDVPQRIQIVLRKMVADLYEFRASAAETEDTLEELPAQWKPMIQGLKVPYVQQPKNTTDAFFL